MDQFYLPDESPPKMLSRLHVDLKQKQGYQNINDLPNDLYRNKSVNQFGMLNYKGFS